MSLRLIFAATAIVGLAAPAFSDGHTQGDIFAYPSSANYCLDSLQPVVLGGVISCGAPNTNEDYLEMMRHVVSASQHWTRNNGQQGFYDQQQQGFYDQQWYKGNGG